MDQVRVEMLQGCQSALCTVGPFVVGFNTFKPSEAEAMADVPTSLQRLWRRRGFLRPKEGSHDRFTTLEVAELTLMRVMTEHGFGVKEAAIEAHRLGLPLCSYLLWGVSSLSVTPLMGDEIQWALETIRLTEFGDTPVEDDDCRFAVCGADTRHFERMSFDEFLHCRFDAATILDLREMAERVRLGTDRSLFVIDPCDKAQDYSNYTARVHAAISNVGEKHPKPYDPTGEMWQITIPRNDNGQVH